MVYKRYIKVKGRICGPYYYESYRDKNGYCPYCYDGIRDYDEEDTDCGGSCKVCLGEIPSGKNNYWIWILILIAIIAVFLMIFNRIRVLNKIKLKVYKYIGKPKKLFL